MREASSVLRYACAGFLPSGYSSIGSLLHIGRVGRVVLLIDVDRWL